MARNAHQLCENPGETIYFAIEKIESLKKVSSGLCERLPRILT